MKTSRQRKILILGGYGLAGRSIAYHLLQETDLDVILAGRSLQKAEAEVKRLRQNFNPDWIGVKQVDVSDSKKLFSALDDTDLVIVASSTSQYAKEVVMTCIEQHVDYFDIQYSSEKLNMLKTISEEIEHSGQLIIAEGGFHPGLPALLVRFIATHFDELRYAVVGSVIKHNYTGEQSLSSSTLQEFLTEAMEFNPVIYREGSWKKVSLFRSDSYINMDFGAEFGKRYGVPMFLEEMRYLPQLFPALNVTGFFIGSINWFVDWVVFPLSSVLLKIWPGKMIRPMSKFLWWGWKTFTTPPFGSLLKLEARGIKNGAERAMSCTISHADAYELTAIPVVACVLQYLEGMIDKRGLVLQGQIAEPVRFMEDIGRMGVHIEIKAQ